MEIEQDICLFVPRRFEGGSRYRRGGLLIVKRRTRKQRYQPQIHRGVRTSSIMLGVDTVRLELGPLPCLNLSPDEFPPTSAPLLHSSISVAANFSSSIGDVEYSESNEDFLRLLILFCVLSPSFPEDDDDDREWVASGTAMGCRPLFRRSLRRAAIFSLQASTFVRR